MTLQKKGLDQSVKEKSESKVQNSKVKRWEDEELDELHNHLYSLLSFITPNVISKMGGYDSTVEGHITAVLKRTNELLDEHGGRFYKP